MDPHEQTRTLRGRAAAYVGLSILDEEAATVHGGLPEENPPRPSRRDGRKKRSRLRKVLTALVVCVAILVAIPVGAALYMGLKLDHQVNKIHGTFAGLSNRPTKPAGEAGKAVNILILGTDRRSDVPTTGKGVKAPEWVPGAQRSDTIMILHIDGRRQQAEVVSIPRDSWVTVPGHGPNKINAAFSYGGPSLAVATVEKLTGVRIDHLAVIDWDGFKALTDAVGGVDVDIPNTVHDSARDITWTAGRHHLSGDQALDYVGERYGLPGGDLDRVKRQQAVLRAILQTCMQQEMRKEPNLLYGFLNTVTKHLAVDDTWSAAGMADLVASMRNFRSADIYYTTAPVAGTGREGKQSVVRLAPKADADLWAALREDRTDQWNAVHWAQLTGESVN